MTNRIGASSGQARSKRGAIRRGLAAVVVLVSLAGCGSASPVAKESATSSGASTGSVDVPKLLQFSAPLVGGGTLSAAEYAGRPSAFWFWAPT